MRRWPVLTLLILSAAACSGADSGPVFTADEVPSPTPTPTTKLVVPLTTMPPDDVGSADAGSNTIVINLVTNLGDGVVEITGTGALSTDPVTIDDAVAAFLTFESTVDGGFVASLPIVGEGTQNVCIAATCTVVDPAG